MSARDLPVATARAEYRRLRATVRDLTREQFDDLARAFVREDSDGEDIFPHHWLRAAQYIANGARKV